MGVKILNRERYGALCAEFVPKVIESEKELDSMTKKLEALTFKPDPLPEEEILARLLTKLVEAYEDERHPIPDAAPQDTLLFLMEQHEMKQADLLDVFGSRSVASDVVNGKRSISKAQAKKLAEKFHTSATIFI